jgi:hypothetical protein
MNRTTLVPVAVALLLLSVAGPVAAHVTKTQGAYTVKVGWADEPPASGARNHVILQAWTTDTEEGVTGLADALTVTVNHAGQSKTLTLVESDEAPGNYSAPILPTEAGLYTIHVAGKLDNATTISQDFAIEDVADGAADAFPVKNDTSATLAKNVQDLTARVTALEAKARTTSSTPATVIGSSPAAKGAPGFEVALAVGAVGAVALALALRRK